MGISNTAVSDPVTLQGGPWPEGRDVRDSLGPLGASLGPLRTRVSDGSQRLRPNSHSLPPLSSLLGCKPLLLFCVLHQAAGFSLLLSFSVELSHHCQRDSEVKSVGDRPASVPTLYRARWKSRLQSAVPSVTCARPLPPSVFPATADSVPLSSGLVSVLILPEMPLPPCTCGTELFFLPGST